MVIERLIQKKQNVNLLQTIYEGGWSYRYADYSRTFHSKYEYWYDGRLFLIGGFGEKDLVIVERETGVLAVTSQDFQRKPTVREVIDKFKEKVRLSGVTIHEVVRKYKSNNLDLELWLINSLII